MAPATSETDMTAGLVTRKDLVDLVEVLSGNLLNGARESIENAIDQVRLLNPDVDLKVEGSDFMSVVREGQIVPKFPPTAEEDGEDGDFVERQGESGEGHVNQLDVDGEEHDDGGA
jgi:hypothetical protein